MKDQNTPERTEFDFNESGETEQQRLEREVLAAGGRVGKKDGNFTFSFNKPEGYKRGDEHRDMAGLFFYRLDKGAGVSRWMSRGGLADVQVGEAERKKKYYEENKDRVSELNKKYYEENKEGVNELNKRWREKNPDKVNAIKRRWRKENREKIAEGGKRYREENREKVAETNKRYREENKEKVAEYQKGYYKESKEKVSHRNKRWAKNNPDKVRAKDARRRARKLEALDPSASKAIIESRYAAQLYLKEVTGCDWHVDHTQPLSLGGKEHENNMQVVPAKWNCSKGNHHCDRWIEDSDIYRYATAVEARFEREAKKNEKK